MSFTTLSKKFVLYIFSTSAIFSKFYPLYKQCYLTLFSAFFSPYGTRTEKYHLYIIY
jgi:hypothetical protein